MDREMRDHIRAMRDRIVREHVRYIAGGNGCQTIQRLEATTYGDISRVKTPDRATRVNVNYIDPTEF